MISTELVCKTLTAAGALDGKTVSFKYDVVEGTTPTNSVYQCVFMLMNGQTQEQEISFYLSWGDAYAFWLGFDSLTTTNPVGAIEAKPAKSAPAKSRKK